MPPVRLILASASPQRRAILEDAGIPFTVVPANVEEEIEGEAAAVAERNARRNKIENAHFMAANARTGVRPLVGRATNPSASGRDFRVVRRGNLINVFGGKMTTFMALARKVALRADNYFGEARVAKEPVFAVQLESAA